MKTLKKLQHDRLIREIELECFGFGWNKPYELDLLKALSENAEADRWAERHYEI